MENEVKFRRQAKNKWEVREELRNGGGLNGGIFKVRLRKDPKGPRFFVEKRFRPSEFRNKIVYREIKLLHQLGDHPYITKMVDHFLDEKAMRASVYLEFCDLGSLDSVISGVSGTNWVSEHKIWNWFIQTMTGLVYCHCGPKPEDDVRYWSMICHRDIKPGNILLKREDGRIIAKLADFGCGITREWSVREKPTVNHSRTSVVTPGFDTPEYPKFCSRSDVWQLALTMVCVCLGIRGPRSRLNPRGHQWDRERPASQYYSKELSCVLKWSLTEDETRRPRVLPLLKVLKEAYEDVKHKLPADNQPLQIFTSTRSSGRGLRHGLAEQAGYAGHPQRTALLRPVRPDPEAERAGHFRNNYVVLNHISPQSPVLPLRPLDPAPYFFQGMPGAYQDPRLFDPMGPRGGYFSPNQPRRRDPFGREYQ